MILINLRALDMLVTIHGLILLFLNLKRWQRAIALIHMLITIVVILVVGEHVVSVVSLAVNHLIICELACVLARS